MPETITEELRDFFRADEPYKFDLHTSFVRNGVRYSTDGRLLLCEPAPGEADTVGNFPDDIEQIVAEYELQSTDGAWSTERLPGPDNQPMEKCATCLGVEGGCLDCDFMGKTWDHRVVRLTPGNWFSVSLLWVLNQLPGMRWRLAGKDSPIVFHCEGGYGLGMWIATDDGPPEHREYKP